MARLVDERVGIVGPGQDGFCRYGPTHRCLGPSGDSWTIRVVTHLKAPSLNDFSTITLEAIGLRSWDQLYAKDPAEVIRLMSEKNVPLHPGDAFLAVLVVRSVADLATASDRLEGLTKRLELLTWALAILGVLTFAVGLIALFK